MYPVSNSAISYVCNRIAASGNNASGSGNSGEKCNVIQ
jgi:hypothetical protein